MTSFSPVEIQTVLPSTIETYKSWCAASPYTPDVQVLGDETTRLLWLGPRKGRHVVLFFHGKAQSCSLMKTHLANPTKEVDMSCRYPQDIWIGWLI